MGGVCFPKQVLPWTLLKRRMGFKVVWSGQISFLSLENSVDNPRTSVMRITELEVTL